jgi:hypothetical protein
MLLFLKEYTHLYHVEKDEEENTLKGRYCVFWDWRRNSMETVGQRGMFICIVQFITETKSYV